MLCTLLLLIALLTSLRIKLENWADFGNDNL